MTPATFYVAFLAVCDGLTVLVKLISHQIYFHEVYLGTAGCKLDFVSFYLSAVANWMLVLICAERFVSVCLPLKRNIIFTKKRCYITVTVITVTFFCIFASMFIAMRDALPGGTECGTLDEYLNFWTNGWIWINICLNLFIPLPIIVVLTVLVIRGLRKSHRDRRCILTNGSGTEDANKRLMKESERLERSITIMLILVAIIFAVISMPAVVFLLTYEESPDKLVQAKWQLFDQIQYMFIDLSHAINFFLYFLTAKKFREQFLYVFTCKRYPKGLSKAKGYEVTNTHSTYATKYTIAKSSEDVSHI